MEKTFSVCSLTMKNTLLCDIYKNCLDHLVKSISQKRLFLNCSAVMLYFYRFNYKYFFASLSIFSVTASIIQSCFERLIRLPGFFGRLSHNSPIIFKWLSIISSEKLSLYRYELLDFLPCSILYLILHLFFFRLPFLLVLV